ncbi:MAG: cation transporter [Bacilli bacterium]|nr:cation transporter [Bacilli bacterium]MBR4350803.1 cation transporter [Bacilli bacterium]
MDKDFKRTANKVSIISIIANTFLAIFKLLAGIFAHSSAMISDAIHSASDVFSSFVVIIGIKLSSKEPDKEHPYGHERLECVAAMILSVILFITGAGIFYNALKNIITGNYNSIAIPGVLALIAAIVSIAIKEAMYWYTRYYAKKIDSSALMADAWHHRSDALSSVGALIGIFFARIGYPIMDSVASIIIFIFIVKASIDIFIDATNKVVDHSCDEELEKEIYNYVMKNKDVKDIDLLKTRMFGNKIYVDLEICLDEKLTLKEAHDIAESLHDKLEKKFDKVKHVMVHVNPVSKKDISK